MRALGLVWYTSFIRPIKIGSVRYEVGSARSTTSPSESRTKLPFAKVSSNCAGWRLLLVAAGSYQWTRLKDACLAQCHRPFAFLIRHGGYRRDALGRVTLGLPFGAYCVGCCWVLMALLFAGGVMNVLWIVLLALFISLEKATSLGRQIAPVAG